LCGQTGATFYIELGQRPSVTNHSFAASIPVEERIWQKIEFGNPPASKQKMDASGVFSIAQTKRCKDRRKNRKPFASAFPHFFESVHSQHPFALIYGSL
jgi:hypothetical protein